MNRKRLSERAGRGPGSLSKRDGWGEFDRVRWLETALASNVKGVLRGIGDDAAVLLPPRREQLVWTIDAQVEGVHFQRNWLSSEDIGFRAYAAAASDVYAMGGAPWCALVSVTLPVGCERRAFQAMMLGVRDAANEAGAPVVGGNMSKGPVLSVTTTLLGRTRSPLLREANEGDRVFVVGELGLARAGLLAFQRRKRSKVLDRARSTWRRPTVLGELARRKVRVSGAIDVSDGLVQDLGHVGRGSRVRMVLEESALSRLAEKSGLRAAARALGEDPLGLMLAGGEDYAVLLFAKEKPHAHAFEIGKVVRGRGLAILGVDGQVRPAVACGFDHFSRAE